MVNAPSGCSLFVCTYLVRRDQRRPVRLDPVAVAFFGACKDSGPNSFPFDAGDDPAFFSSRFLDGPVTWGVCRADVRNQVKPGDWVAFFAAEDGATGGQLLYRFVGVMRVDRLESGLTPGAPFDRYLNRLVTPAPGGFRHHEPALDARDWHKDWLWRLGGHRWGDKKTVVGQGLAGQLPAASVATPELGVANYVVFDQANSVVIARPPVVARLGPGSLQETWDDSDVARRLRKMLFGTTGRQHLRTLNRQQPHRHLQRQLDPNEAIQWHQEVRACTCALGGCE